MHRILKKEQILTIPNFLSLLRLLMIPIIVWFYCVELRYREAVAVILLSGITDIADGIIARRFNMVSDFGKILDPIADKLTQVTLIACLISKYDLMIPLIVEFVVREFIMLVLGYLTIRKHDKVNSVEHILYKRAAYQRNGVYNDKFKQRALCGIHSAMVAIHIRTSSNHFIFVNYITIQNNNQEYDLFF